MNREDLPEKVNLRKDREMREQGLCLRSKKVHFSKEAMANKFSEAEVTWNVGRKKLMK